MKHIESRQNKLCLADYNVVHFEALGSEADLLKCETARAVRRGDLPLDFRGLTTPHTLQASLSNHPSSRLPRMITIKTHSHLPKHYLEGPRKSVVTRSVGYDHVEHLADIANIASLREYCVNAVAQTVMKFLYAAAGELNHYAKHTATFTRDKSRAFMELGPHKCLTVYGVGKIGRRIYELAEANGLSVQGVDLRQDELSKEYGGSVKFVSKAAAIVSSHIIVNAMNLTANPESEFYNVGYFSKKYLCGAQPGLIFINVTRGEIAPESGLWELYCADRIMGIGLDVFSDESRFAALANCDTPSGDNDHAAAEVMVKKALDRDANIYVQPHQAFHSDIALKAKARETINHLVAWCRNKGCRFDEQLPCKRFS